MDLIVHLIPHNMLKHDIPKTMKEWDFTKKKDPNSAFMMKAFDFYINPNATMMVINASFDKICEFLRNKKCNLSTLPYENGRDSTFDFKNCADIFTPDFTIEDVVYDFTYIKRYIKSSKRIFWADKLPLIIKYRKNWCIMLSPIIAPQRAYAYNSNK